jgi:pimeloyl-ACP methyl ester carboxylesterase
MEFTKQHSELVSNLVLSGTILPKADSMQSVYSERYEKQVDFLMNGRQEVDELLKPFKDKGADKPFHTISDIDKSNLSHKDLTEYWRIRFASVNIYDVKKYNLVKGGGAYYKGEASVMTETVNWNYDYRSVMNNTKTTIINGAYDYMDFDGDTLKTLLNGFPNIQLYIIPDAGHNSWIDNPKLFKQYLLTALK